MRLLDEPAKDDVPGIGLRRVGEEGCPAERVIAVREDQEIEVEAATIVQLPPVASAGRGR
jgi:hypothetical protein